MRPFLQFLQGEVTNGDVYFILSGQVSLRMRKSSFDVEVARLGRGSFFGEDALFDGGKLNHVTAISIGETNGGDTTVIVLPGDVVECLSPASVQELM